MQNTNLVASELSTVVLTAARDTLDGAGLLGRALLVALSGGLDSICLLRVLAAVAQRNGGRLEVAHVDHGLRAGSGADAQFCRGTAEELGLPFHLLELSPEDFQGGKGLQAEARRLRRAFFEEVLFSMGLDAVALGHHADDQAETILLRTVRGAGPRGIGGMSGWAPPYVRPLLKIRRKALETLAKGCGWDFREDPSNRSGRYLRNRIRHEVLPLLRTLNPSVEVALERLARLSAEDDDWLSGEAARALILLGHREPEGLRFPVRELNLLGGPIRRRLWLAACQAVGGDPAVLEFEHVETVDDLLDPGRPQRRASVPGPVRFARCWEDVWVLRPDAAMALVDSVRLTAPGRVPLGVFDVQIVWGHTDPGVQALCLSPGLPRGDLVLRPRRPGDRLGHRKVKDILMEGRMPAWRRGRTLVVEDGGGVLGLLGPGLALGALEPDRSPPNHGIWLEERGEKRWCV